MFMTCAGLFVVSIDFWHYKVEIRLLLKAIEYETETTRRNKQFFYFHFLQLYGTVQKECDKKDNMIYKTQHNTHPFILLK